MQKIGKMFINLILLILGLSALGIVVPNLFGIKTMAVLSGSMEPAYTTGSLVYVVPTNSEEIKEGDVVSFLLNSQGTVVTHRVVEVDKENDRFFVKGDANQTKDANPVKSANILGVVRFGIPMLGYALSFLLTTGGKIIAGTIIIGLIIMIFLFEDNGEKEESEMLSKKKGTSKRRESSSKKKTQKMTEIKKKTSGKAGVKKVAAENAERKRLASRKSVRMTTQKRRSSKTKQVTQKKRVYSIKNRYVPRYK